MVVLGQSEWNSRKSGCVRERVIVFFGQKMVEIQQNW